MTEWDDPDDDGDDWEGGGDGYSDGEEWEDTGGEGEWNQSDGEDEWGAPGGDDRRNAPEGAGGNDREWDGYRGDRVGRGEGGPARRPRDDHRGQPPQGGGHGHHGLPRENRGQGHHGQPRENRGQGHHGKPRENRGQGHHGQPRENRGQGHHGQPREGRGQGHHGQPQRGHGQHGQPGHGQPRGGRHGERTSQQKGQDIRDGKVRYAIYFPFSAGWKPLILGVVMYIFSFLIIPVWVLYGYSYNLVNSAANGNRVQPPFEDFGQLLVRGLLYWVFLLVFLIVSLLLTVAIPAGLGFVLADVEGAIILGLLGYMIWGYILPAGMILYPVTGSFGSAFSPRRIWNFVGNGHYLVAYLILLAVMLALQIAFMIAFVILAVTVIGLLIAIPAMFILGPYFLYFFDSYWGAVYFEAAEKGLVEYPEDLTSDQKPEYESHARRM